MLQSGRLPKFTFIDKDGKSEEVRLSQMTPRIRAVASHLQAKIKPGAVVGLMCTSEPNLVINWLACIAAKLCPLVMQYPTKKQSRAYWADSVKNTIEVGRVEAIVADGHCAGLGLSEFSPTIAQKELDALPDGAAKPISFDTFSIMQLSSGTTGYRKAIKFESADLERHVGDYNESLGLTKTDKIISWLPLYHDMGYVACFVMPMMLGIDVVMMDPMTWIGKPELLYDAIEHYSGTVCYMPNFGFEVLSRLPGRKLDSMRWWISCSEPVSAETARKFLAKIDAKPEVFAPCYAMAENIFAISIRRGLQTRTIDEADVVSCGWLIRGVRSKIVDGEIWITSPTSLKAYVGGDDIRDAEGFYPTGDLGAVHDGELYVTGRKQDLLIQAGKKFMLSDIDLALNRLYPDVRGRAVTVQTYDERLGTQRPLVLIENDEFFLRKDHQAISDALKDSLGIDQIDVQYVPPRFLTKTSSGKFNRKKSLENWQLAQNHARQAQDRKRDIKAELEDSFSTVAWDQPVKEVMDSLSLTILRFLLADTHVEYDGELTLNAIAERLSEATAPAAATAQPEQAIHIVSLADLPGMSRVVEFIERNDFLSRRLKERVTFEHVALPPSPIILSDLIFCDYFLPRLDPSPFDAVTRTLNKLRDASMIIIDDTAELALPPFQTYGVLSHNLERDPSADLVATRWQRYAKFHDQLPLTVAVGQDLSPADRTRSIELLGAYLKKPIFRMSLSKEADTYTQGWEFRAYEAKPGRKIGVHPPHFAEHLKAWIEAMGPAIERKPVANPAVVAADMNHFCSHFANKEAIDKVIARFGSFCIAGQSASVPYVRKELERLGKPYVQTSGYAPEVLAPYDGKFECLMICGAMGNYPITKPTAAVMFVKMWATRNIDDPDLQGLKFKDRTAKTQADWFYPFSTKRRPVPDELKAIRAEDNEVRKPRKKRRPVAERGGSDASLEERRERRERRQRRLDGQETKPATSREERQERRERRQRRLEAKGTPPVRSPEERRERRERREQRAQRQLAKPAQRERVRAERVKEDA